ncbi:hypothetical protein MOV66_07740 [Agrobacterium sp. SHOUNA12C]|nr:hypothetical protein [Agrobacterium sp. BETTINA12B]MCJ9756532.1 hypothetical protein [Agrobacterium sp. SHOUNA12C]
MGHTLDGEALPETEIRRFLKLYRDLNDLANNRWPMPEEAMDCIVDAIGVIARAIADTPATTKSDVADKFRFLAELIDDPAGTSSLEDEVLAHALASLSTWKKEQEDEHERAILAMRRNLDEVAAAT